MKKIERLELIDRIGRELQARMSFPDIDVYLQGFGVDTSKPTSGINSKWVYSKERLADSPAKTIVEIADELDISHPHLATSDSEAVQATFWEPHHFRLFISHLASFKKKAGALQAALRRYGISAFVAHVDIEPTREWQGEIEAGLWSMDAMAVLLMPGFKDSDWTDQEVGFAVGRGTLVVPIIKGLNPYGFIGKYQGLQSSGKTVAQVAHEVFRIIVASSKTRARMLACLVETTLQAPTEAEAIEKLEHLSSLQELPVSNLERLREGAVVAGAFEKGQPLDRLNDLLKKRGLQRVPDLILHVPAADDDVPF